MPPVACVKLIEQCRIMVSGPYAPGVRFSIQLQAEKALKCDTMFMLYKFCIFYGSMTLNKVLASPLNKRLGGGGIKWMHSAVFLGVIVRIFYESGDKPKGRGGSLVHHLKSRDAAHGIRIVALGDSLTEGFGVAPEDSYPVRLEALLNRKGFTCRVVNAGISGDTCRRVLTRLPSVLKSGPDLVVLEIGINDILMGALPERIHANISSIAEQLRANGIAVAIAGMVLPSMGDPHIEEAFAGIYPETATALGLTLIPSFNAPVFEGYDRVQYDGIHPTAAGYAAVTAHMLPWVIRALERLPGSRFPSP